MDDYDKQREKLEARLKRKQARLDDLRDRYWKLTTEELPELAAAKGWEIQEGHCFQRILLDYVCKGVWYHKLAEPAIMHMSEAQLRKAVYLASEFITGHRLIEPYNQQSIDWRKAEKICLFDND